MRNQRKKNGSTLKPPAGMEAIPVAVTITTGRY
jgi:hypothetical protein